MPDCMSQIIKAEQVLADAGMVVLPATIQAVAAVPSQTIQCSHPPGWISLVSSLRHWLALLESSAAVHHRARQWPHRRHREGLRRG